MDLLNHLTDDWIHTDDLYFINPNGKYTFYFKYLGEGCFFLKSKGYIDEKSFKQQFTTGDVARERLRNKFPDFKYHLIWDTSEVSGVSFFARRLILFKLKGNENFGSITLVGTNFFAQSFIKLLLNTLPTIKFNFFQNLEEANRHFSSIFPKINFLNLSENEYITNSDNYYSLFLEKWEDAGAKTLQINNHSLKYISRPEWKFQSVDNSFQVEISLIEGKVIFYKVSGYAKPEDIDNTYEFMHKIIEEFKFNQTDNRFYSIVDLKKLKGVTLSARKRTSYFESVNRNFAHFVIFMPSKLLMLMYKVVVKVSKANFEHWVVSSNLQEAFDKIYLHQRGEFIPKSTIESEKRQDTLIIPKNKSELVDLVHKLNNEIHQLKKNQKEQIQKILSFTGNMTWDESFVPPVIDNNDSDPFNSVFDSLIILYNDFKEIIEDTMLKAQQLQESEDKYRNLINLASDVIAVYQDDRLRFVNSRVTSALGYTPEEVMEKPMYSYVVPEEVSKLEDYYKKRISNENVPWVYETVFIHKDGHKVPVSMSVGRVMYEGKPASMLIARDITQKKKTEEELERYRNHLEEIVRKRTEQLQKEVNDRRIAEESDRLKTAFLSNMSHEIRTPMNAIIGFSNFLKEPGLTKEQHDEFLNYIQSSGQSLLNLINDIIDISKIEAKQLNIQLSNCKVDSLLDELYQLFEQYRRHNKRDNVDLVLKVPEKNGIVLKTDPYRLKQILSNLIDNAFKFTDKGFIEFGYTHEKNGIQFYVKDTGIGIAPDKKDVIFKRFGRVYSNNRNLSGTGLGLAISKNLASLLNGKLWVDSKVNMGSVFYLKLPNSEIVEEPQFKSILQNDGSSEYHWTGKRVLIAEDEDLNFRVFEIALARSGIEIIRAQNGKEALNLLSQSKLFDIILMDIQMPEMDGYEAMSIIKKLYPQIPIIAQTAFALLEERKKCLELGFDDYIAKPIHLDELYKKMDAFLK